MSGDQAHPAGDLSPVLPCLQPEVRPASLSRNDSLALTLSPPGSLCYDFSSSSFSSILHLLVKPGSPDSPSAPSLAELGLESRSLTSRLVLCRGSSLHDFSQCHTQEVQGKKESQDTKTSFILDSLLSFASGSRVISQSLSPYGPPSPRVTLGALR